MYFYLVLLGLSNFLSKPFLVEGVGYQNPIYVGLCF